MKANFTTLATALKAIENFANSFATLKDCKLIASDCKISTDEVRGNFKDLKAEKCLQYCTEQHPYTYYFAFRDHGCEGGTSKSQVIERLRHLGDPFATMVLTYSFTEGYNLKTKLFSE